MRNNHYYGSMHDCTFPSKTTTRKNNLHEREREKTIKPIEGESYVYKRHIYTSFYTMHNTNVKNNTLMK